MDHNRNRSLSGLIQTCVHNQTYTDLINDCHTGFERASAGYTLSAICNYRTNFHNFYVHEYGMCIFIYLFSKNQSSRQRWLDNEGRTFIGKQYIQLKHDRILVRMSFYHGCYSRIFIVCISKVKFTYCCLISYLALQTTCFLSRTREARACTQSEVISLSCCVACVQVESIAVCKKIKLVVNNTSSMFLPIPDFPEFYI